MQNKIQLLVILQFITHLNLGVLFFKEGNVFLKLLGCFGVWVKIELL